MPRMDGIEAVRIIREELDSILRQWVRNKDRELPAKISAAVEMSVEPLQE